MNIIVMAHGNTDVGCVRQNNEDTFICEQIWDEQHWILAAIDGMGGYEGGEVAAAIARDTILDYLKQYPNGECLEILKNAVCSANNAIHEQRKGELCEMGCVATAVIVECDQNRINMVHVGDTRLYQMNLESGMIEKLSHDHSLVGYREEIGQLTEEEAMHHPQRSRIDRDLGRDMHEVNDDNFIEASIFQLVPNTVLLLCSDGLCDMITSSKMCEILLAKSAKLNERVDKLIAAAKEAGGNDNVTVVLFECLNSGEKKVGPTDGNEVVPDSVIVNDEIVEPVLAQDCDSNKKRRCSSIVKIVVLVIAIIGIGIASFWGGICYQKNVESQPVDTIVKDTTPVDTTYHADSLKNDTVGVRHSFRK